MRDCLFCRIAAGDLQAEIVLQDEAAVAFLDHRPLFPGHTLLVPRKHTGNLHDLDAELIAPFFVSAQKLSRAVQTAMGAEGTFCAINNTVSQSVPHLHLHVVPRKRKDGLRGFFWPRVPYASVEEMRRVAQLIREALSVF